ncbi:MAG: GWxTD domain-containing protein [Gemmatimonadaceae bacterium]
MRPRPILTLGCFVAAALASNPVSAQTKGHPQVVLSRADSLAAFGDTATALAVLDSVVRRQPRNAAAWNRLGMLAWAKVRPERRLSFMRSQESISLLRKADSSLRLAHIHAPDSGRYAMDLARFFLFAEFITLRAQAPGRFERAYQAARRAGDSVLIAEVADELGMVHWRRYEAMANRRLLRGMDVAHLDQLATSSQGASNFLENFTTKLPGRPGQADYDKASVFFSTALRANPNNERALRHTFMTLAEAERWEELRSAADYRLQSSPFDPKAWLARGVAAHRLGLDNEATAAFDSALAFLTPRDSGRYINISRVLRAADSSGYANMNAAERAELERVYWAVSDPLWLTNANEHRLEFLTRVAFAEMRWTSDDLDLRGADTDRGQIWIRYGPPPVIASFAPAVKGGRSCSGASETHADCDASEGAGFGTILWYYPALNLHFMFRAPPSYGVASFVGNYEEMAREARRAAPVTWTNVPISAQMDTIHVQLARFRAGADSADLAVYADVPIRKMVGKTDISSGVVDVAFTAFDARARRIARDSASQTVRFEQPDAAELRAWRHRFAASELGYRVEAWQPDAGRGARASGVIRIGTERGFGMSDVVVAKHIMPRDSAPARWTDYVITPSAGLLAQRQSFGLMWETYELQAREGTVNYKVEIVLTVIEVERPENFVARIVGGVADVIGLSARGDNRVALSYNRQRDARAIVTDDVTLELGSAPAGRYRLTVQITDLVTDRATDRTRELVVAP